MDPSYSPISLLADLGLGRYTAAAVSLLAFVVFIITHLMPYVPQPTTTTNGFVTFLWKIGNAITGGYGNAKPSATVSAPATPAQVPPAMAVPVVNIFKGAT